MVMIVVNIIEILTYSNNIFILILVGWFVSSLEISVHLTSIKKDWTNIVGVFRYILNCIKCSTFWITLIYTQSFTMALYCSFGAYLLDVYILKNDITL